MDLEKEAEKYRLSTDNQMYIEKQAFIAGADSKWVQIEKLKFAIEAVLQFRKATFGLGNSGLAKLQQELKQLEDGSK